MQEFVEVSPEMTLLLGGGPTHPLVPLPPDFLILSFDTEDDAPTLELDPAPNGAPDDDRLHLAIMRSAFRRVGGAETETGSRYHLPSDLRLIALAIRAASLGDEVLSVYRLGKSIELLCETIRLQAAGQLVPLAGDGALSLEDTRRVYVARRIIDERWQEKLTLDRIARDCGLNRAKLTRAFRETFHCSVAEAIAERRLSQASRMLRTTDLPVSSIGYESGYLNNASFARAFGRRYGVSPSDFRAERAHAA